MDSSPPTNPYRPDGQGAFAGRDAAFARLHQHLTSPTHEEAVLFLGRRRVGKTALLKNFAAFFDDTFIDMYVPLKQTSIEDEDDWIMHLAREMAKALAVRDFTLTRLPEPSEEDKGLRVWFAESYLHELLGIMRYRRLVLLLDDADVLLHAIKDDLLPDDHFAFLHGLLARYPQLGIALTLDTEHEASVPSLHPLVNAAETFRLTNLSQVESRALLQEPLARLYPIPDESAVALYRATGGQPLLLQRVGRHLFEQGLSQPTRSLYMERGAKEIVLQVKPTINKVYAESEAEFREAWQQTTRDERLALTAMVSLLYDDPLTTIDTARIEGWLVETDYPLDPTAINAALRSLEYAEIVDSTPDGLVITSGMMQTWLLEHARLGESPVGAPESPSFPLDWRWMVAIVVVVVIVLLAISSAGQPSANTTPLPTVTLAGGG